MLTKARHIYAYFCWLESETRLLDPPYLHVTKFSCEDPRQPVSVSEISEIEVASSEFLESFEKLTL